MLNKKTKSELRMYPSHGRELNRNIHFTTISCSPPIFYNSKYFHNLKNQFNEGISRLPWPLLSEPSMNTFLWQRPVRPTPQSTINCLRPKSLSKDPFRGILEISPLPFHGSYLAWTLLTWNLIFKEFFFYWEPWKHTCPLFKYNFLFKIWPR